MVPTQVTVISLFSYYDGCQLRGHGEAGQHLLTVVDTPGLRDTDTEEKNI